MERQDDPWAESLARWTSDNPTEPIAPDDPPPPSSGRSIRVTVPRLVIASLLTVIVLTVAVGASVIAFVNDDRADEWRDRSQSLQSLVNDRTKELNEQTKRLNTAAATLKKSQDALERSESDVEGLESRQRALANEKAQLADQRAFLERATGLLQSCNTGLAQVLASLSDGTDPSTTLDLDAIQRTCQDASSAMPQGTN